MNKTIIKAIALTSLVLPISSFAGNVESESSNVRFYGQIDLGKSYMDINDKSYIGYYTDKQQSSAALRIGYELPSQNTVHLGLELGSQYFGEYTLYNNVSSLYVKQGALDLLMVVRKDINPLLSVFAKGGIASVIQQSALDNYYSPYISYQEIRGIKPELAAGLKFDLNRNVALLGTVSHIFADHLNANSPKLNYLSTTSASLGMRVSFG